MILTKSIFYLFFSRIYILIRHTTRHLRQLSSLNKEKYIYEMVLEIDRLEIIHLSCLTQTQAHVQGILHFWA